MSGARCRLQPGNRTPALPWESERGEGRPPDRGRQWGDAIRGPALPAPAAHPAKRQSFHPDPAPRTMAKGPTGQRKQSTMSWFTSACPATPSSTTRAASRSIAP